MNNNIFHFYLVILDLSYSTFNNEQEKLFINIFKFFFFILVILYVYYHQLQQMGAQNSKENINYLYPIPNSREPGFTPIYRNPRSPNQLSRSTDPQLKNYRDIFLNSTSKNSNRKCAGSIKVTKSTKDGKQVQEKSIEYLTYKQCFDKAELLGRGILGMKLQYHQKVHGMRFVGIYAKNRIEWLLTDLACVLYGLTSVPLYDTLGKQNLSYCLNQTQMTTLFLTQETLKSLLQLKDHGGLKNVVLFDRIDPQTLKKANAAGLSVLDFNALINQGKKFSNFSYKDYKIQPQSIYTFSYTSGTTGPPKGAMISHLNITSFLSSVQNLDIKFYSNDVYLSFLPLPHIFERVVVTKIVEVGAHLIFYAGDMLKMKEDCALVKPTLFAGVPRIYNKIVQKVQQGFQQKTGIIKCLIDSGVQTKKDNILNKGDNTHFFYDKLIFSKVRDAFGGRVRLMVSGGAPLSVKSKVFMETLMSAPLYQAYGQTQNTALAFVRESADYMNGHVGGIASNFEFRLNDIPQMKYTSDDKDQKGRSAPRGQIWLRGPGVIPGYYKLKQKTQQAITRDGWLKTGDVGVIMAESGRMKIIDRRKNIFKLQQGEYVAPQKVQAIYARTPYAQQVFHYGESAHNFCIAIIKPKQQHFIQLAKKHNISGSYEELCRNDQMRKLVIKEIFAFGKKQGLNTFQQAKNIYFEPTSFADKKILTNTMKLQRFQAKTVYKQVIERLYEEGELPIR